MRPAGRARTNLQNRGREWTESPTLACSLGGWGPSTAFSGQVAACSFPAGSSTIFPLPRRLPVVPGHVQTQVKASTGSRTWGLAHALHLWLPRERRKKERGLAVGVQDSRMGEHNGLPAPPDSKRGAGNVERTGEGIHQDRSNRQRRAGLSFLPACSDQLCSPSPVHVPPGLAALPSPSLLCWVIVARLGGGERELQM